MEEVSLEMQLVELEALYPRLKFDTKGIDDQTLQCNAVVNGELIREFTWMFEAIDFITSMDEFQLEALK